VPAPFGVELVEELRAALLLIVLTDGGGRGAQPVQRAEKALVGRVPPPHVARSAPTRLAQPVETAVVADPEVRVRLDVVAGKLSESGPRVEEPGPARDDVRHRRSPILGVDRQRGVEGGQRVRRLG